MPRKKQIINSGESMQSELETQVSIIKQCEREVVAQWQVMARAVKEIHANRLWEIGYESFEHCMSDAIGWKKSWAYEMLKAAEVLEDAPITDASMARYLHPLQPQQRQLAWQEAVEVASPEKPTRDDVKKAASLMRGGMENEDGESKEEDGKESGAPDQEPPKSIVPPAAEFDMIIAMLREARNAIEELSEKPEGSFITPAQIVVDLKNVFNALTWAKPHCVCVYCQGEGCKHCQFRGWLCKGLYASAPEDMKS